MPNINLSILNQKATPAFFADTLANRPAPSFVGRIFISTDTLDLYRDTGSAWLLLSPSSTGTITGSGAAGQVTIFSGASSITGTNNLFWDTSNLRLGINTNTPGAAIDLHSTASTLMQLNQTTATNDTRIAFQNSGTALWRIGNFYNAGANDWGIFDVVGAAQPFTIKKTTGQTFIGAETTSSGRLVVNNTTGDNHIVVIGATAPSIRINNSGSGATKQIGIGLATAVNNFIQGSADRDMCIFNGSTTQSPILFGIYGTTNVQEVARFSVGGNLLVGKTTDAGYKLDVSGTSRISGNLLVEAPSQDNILSVIGQSGYEGALFISSAGSGKDANIVFGNTRNLEFHSTSSTTPVVSGTTLMTLTNNGNLGIGIAPTNRLHVYNTGTTYASIEGTGNNTVGLLTKNGNKQYFTGTYYNTSDAWEVADITAGGLSRLTIAGTGAATFSGNVTAGTTGNILSLGTSNTSDKYLNILNSSGNFEIGTNSTTHYIIGNGALPLSLYTNGNYRARITSGGNLLIGSTTDNGDKLQVTGRTISSLGFKSITGSVSIASGATATIFTMNDNALYLVQIIVTSGSIIYSAANWFLSHASNGQYVNAGGLYDGANVTLANAGADIQITNNGFGTFTWNYTILTQCF